MNLIETSSIYGDTQAQSLIGEVIAELVEDKRLQREVVLWFLYASGLLTSGYLAFVVFLCMCALV